MEQNLIKKEPIGNGFDIFVSPHHTFGTDAVLLADFAAAKANSAVCDLGTGCGIIPFLMLRDKQLKTAVGVDISKEAVSLAEKTAKECGFSCFKAICSDIADLNGKTDFGCFDLVTCNPPYKAAGAGIKSSDNVTATARHEIAGTLENTVSAAARLLKTSGRLCMCIRTERAAELITLMSNKGIEPKRMRLVCKDASKEPWLVLIEGRRCGNTGIRIMPTLFVYENGELSGEMQKIYGPYKEAYLK